jgi:hypothetical protein
MKKKGQITVFIIVGIIILFLALLVFYLWNYGHSSRFNPFLFSENSLKSFVTDCIEKETEDGIYELGVHGGYIYVPKEIKLITSINELGEEMSYTSLHLMNNKTYLPSLETMQTDLSRYIEENLVRCLDDFSIYKQKSIIISYRPPKAKTVITTDSVAVNLEFPVTAKKGDSEKMINNFNYEKRGIRIPYTIEASNFITNFFQENPRSIDLTALKEYSLDIAITPYNPMTFIIMITDKQSIIHNKPYNFRFSVSAE